MIKGFVLSLTITAAVFVFSVSPVLAQSITRVTSLTFGSFALKNNTTINTYQISRIGALTVGPAFVPITSPVRGEYLLSGFPPSTTVTNVITATPISIGGGGGGELFTVSLDYRANLTTDGAGDVTLFIGGTLQTSGSGTMYADGSYSGEIDITVNY